MLLSWPIAIAECRPYFKNFNRTGLAGLYSWSEAESKGIYFSESVAKWLVSATNIGKGFYFSGPASRRPVNIIFFKMIMLYDPICFLGSLARRLLSVAAQPSGHLNYNVILFHWRAARTHLANWPFIMTGSNFIIEGLICSPQTFKGGVVDFTPPAPHPHPSLEIFLSFILRQSFNYLSFFQLFKTLLRRRKGGQLFHARQTSRGLQTIPS